MTDKDMSNIYGGATSITALINALAKAYTTIMDIGKMIGSSIRRAKNKNFC